MDSISKHSETRVQMFVFRHLSCKIHLEFWKQEFWENICAHVLIFIPFISLWLCTKTWMWYQRRDALSSSFFPSAVNVQVHTNTTNTTTTINTSSKLSHAHADILIMGGRDVEIKTSICFCISCNVSFVMTCSHCGKLTLLLCDLRLRLCGNAQYRPTVWRFPGVFNHEKSKNIKGCESWTSQTVAVTSMLDDSARHDLPTSVATQEAACPPQRSGLVWPSGDQSWCSATDLQLMFVNSNHTIVDMRRYQQEFKKCGIACKQNLLNVTQGVAGSSKNDVLVWWCGSVESSRKI